VPSQAVIIAAMPKLFRPVGLHEMSLLWDMEWRGFPPRLPHQPIFYPVKTREYAREIASQWNIKDEPSGFGGFVTEFAVADEYLSKFDPRTVGTINHVEYWIPSEELATFNQQIVQPIRVTEAYFGETFRGYIPDSFGLRGKDAAEQFMMLARTWQYSRMDFICEAALNCKTIYINSWFWAQHDFVRDGLSEDDTRKTIAALQRAWEHNKIGIPLPAPLLSNSR
jgi:hypothetical protein